MQEREIMAPISCDECYFHQRINSTFEECKLYPHKPKPYPRKSGTKYDFCKLDKIVVHEKE